MRYLDFLQQVHLKTHPESYLEVGVRNGHSLAKSSVPSVGVDPAYEIASDVTLGDHVTLARQTSDDFFAAADPLATLPNQRIDLAFIDGMHLYEFALRDFTNIERLSRPGSVIIFDDVLPRNSTEAQRDRETSAWTGDVWKIIPTLRRLRPDLMAIQIGTQPTGLLMVIGADPASTTLHDQYDELLAKWAGPDHVEPPARLLSRRNAMAPEAVLDASFWSVLLDVRAGAATAQDLRRAVQSWTASAMTPSQAESVTRSFAPPKPPPAPAPMTLGRIVRGVRRRISRPTTGKAVS